jgi:phosphinothricin acetyltransferase
VAVVRAATEDDLPAITDLYNALIPTTTTAWTETLQTLDERIAWFAERQRRGHAVLVAEVDGEVVGFTAYGEFRDNVLWPGYRFTAELTMHVDGAHHGRGIGRALMDALLEAARAAGLHVLIAAVDGENTGALAFYRALDFVEVGRLPETGWKFGRWLDLVLLQRFVD